MASNMEGKARGYTFFLSLESLSNPPFFTRFRRPILVEVASGDTTGSGVSNRVVENRHY